MTAYEVWGVKKADGRLLVFPSTRVNVYDPLARGGIKSKDKLYATGKYLRGL
ncbi:MAG: hypothetical protein RXR43_11475 [Sulfolobus sp.]